MSSLMQSNIFFFVTTIVVVILGVLAAIALIYLIKILNGAKKFEEKISESAVLNFLFHKKKKKHTIEE